MQSSSLRQVNFNLLQRFVVRVLLPVAIALYLTYSLTAGQWLLLGVLSVAALAIKHRINSIHSLTASTSHREGRVICADGGSFGPEQQVKQEEITITPVVKDGGSFERSSLN